MVVINRSSICILVTNCDCYLRILWKFTIMCKCHYTLRCIWISQFIDYLLILIAFCILKHFQLHIHATCDIRFLQGVCIKAPCIFYRSVRCFLADLQRNFCILQAVQYI